jgi:Na+-transporting NADH:ubiquinone oxidoreductase subunit B
MKWLLKLLDALRPSFAKDGELKMLKPVFDAMDSFLFAPLLRTKTSPHIRDALDVKRYMSMVIVALIPCVLASVYFFGLRVLAMIVVSYAVGGAVEVVFAMARKEEINEGFLVTGLLFPLILPPTLPLWMVGAGSAFGVLVGKELFGGTGRNLFNPALVGRCFLALSYPKAMSSEWFEAGSGWFGSATRWSSDALSGATPLTAAKNGEWSSLLDMFLGNTSGSVGETSAVALILGGLLLMALKIANWRTVLSMLVSFGLMTMIVFKGDMQIVVWHFLAGGLLFGAFFMATDPVTSPMTQSGKWVYGALIGLVTVLIRNFTGYVEGVMFAILLGNIFAPVIDEIFVALHIRRLGREG